MSLLFADWAVDTASRALHRDWAVAIEGDSIVDAGSKSDIISKYPSYEKFGGRRCVMIPALFNSHTHLPMVLLRSAAEQQPMAEWFEKSVNPRERLLDESLVKLGAKVAAAEFALNGVGGVFDMYFHEDKVVEGAEEVGIRGIFSYGMIDYGNKEKADTELKETLNFYSFIRGRRSPLAKTAVAPHALYTCSPDILKRAGSLSLELNSPVNLHLAERPDEIELVRRTFGIKVSSFAAYLKELNLLGPRLVLAHCTNLSLEDMNIFGRAGAFAALNPTSNLRLGNGLPPANKAKLAKLEFGVGTDGACSNDDSNLLSEAKMLLVSSMVSEGPRLDLWDAVSALTLPTGRFFARDIGLSRGCLADIAIFEMGLGSNPSGSILGNLTYSTDGVRARHLTVGGKHIVVDGKLVNCEKERLFDEYEQATRKIEEMVDDPD
jgi:5-methylthioadenosine/S-adenosylhomocysteine deaminase